MLKRAVTCVGAVVILTSCSQWSQPAQPSASVRAGVNQLQQKLSSHKFDGQTAHVQFDTQVSGATVSAAFFADHIKDKSTVSGNNKFDDVIIGIFQQDAAGSGRVLVQAFASANIRDGEFKITGDSKSASLRTTVPVLNDVDGTMVPVTLALDFEATGQVLNDTSSRQKFRFGDFTFLTAFKQFTTIADVRGTASWFASGVATRVIAPLTNGDTFATLDSTVSVDRFTSK
jgi:hypothetical protein